MDDARSVPDSDDHMMPDLPSDRPKVPSKLIPILKWGGCYAAAGFAFAGLLLEIAQPVAAYDTLSQNSWIIATICMVVGFTGAVLDRSEEPPKS